MEPPPIPLIKSRHDDKLDKDFVKLKICSDTTSEKLDIYEYKMALFGNGEPDEFLLFVCNFNMNLEASGMMETSTKVQYLHTLVSGEALHQFDSMSVDAESANHLTVEAIILGLGL